MAVPPKVTKIQLLKLIDDLEKRPHDKVRILGDVGITVVGAGLGVAAAGTVAAAAGATTILGSTVLGSTLGGIFVAATPVGWILGIAAAAGASAFAVSRLIRNGATAEGKKAELLNKYREEEQLVAAKEEAGSITDKDRTNFTVALRDLIAHDVILPDVATHLIAQVERGGLPISKAFELIGELLKDPKPASAGLPKRVRKSP
jgi:hypothetical protein